jgi:hypothetical protein
VKNQNHFDDHIMRKDFRFKKDFDAGHSGGLRGAFLLTGEEVAVECLDRAVG